MTVLRGLTWDHDRGFSPLAATARSVPGIEIAWERRSLQAFGEADLAEAVKGYDLVVVDHPFVGEAAASGLLLPVDELLGAEVIALRERDSVGPSHRSYRFAGRQWALAVDAAAHVSVARPDLCGADLPRTWDEVEALARALRRHGRWMALAAFPLDAFLSVLTLSANAGSPALGDDGRWDVEALRDALARLRALAALGHPRSVDANPPAVLEAMSTEDEIAYCPLLFGYSNYARPGYRAHRLRFAGVPSAGLGSIGGVLGGTGIAMPASSRQTDAAARFAAWITDPATQAGPYVRAGGQPASRSAWTAAEGDRLTGGYFAATLEALDRAHLRPRFAGFPAFQVRAGAIVHEHLTGACGLDAAVRRLGALAAEVAADQPYRRAARSTAAP